MTIGRTLRPIPAFNSTKTQSPCQEILDLDFSEGSLVLDFFDVTSKKELREKYDIEGVRYLFLGLLQLHCRKEENRLLLCDKEFRGEINSLLSELLKLSPNKISGLNYCGIGPRRGGGRIYIFPNNFFKFFS